MHFASHYFYVHLDRSSKSRRYVENGGEIIWLGDEIWRKFARIIFSRIRFKIYDLFIYFNFIKRQERTCRYRCYLSVAIVPFYY